MKAPKAAKCSKCSHAHRLGSICTKHVRVGCGCHR